MNPFSRRRFLQYAAGGTAAALGGSLLERVPPAVAAGPTNPIVVENQLAGTGAFQLGAGFSSGFTGYAARTCIEVGDPLAVKVVSFLSAPNNAGHIEVYRLGYYGAQGGRLVYDSRSSFPDFSFTTQSGPSEADAQTGLRGYSTGT